FNKHEWIGKNKIYPRHPPRELEVYCARQLCIPQKITNASPDKALNVAAFLRAELPAKSHALVFPAAETCFSRLTPSMDIYQMLESLKTRPLPPMRLVNQLNQAARQAILDGNLSVADSRFPGTRFSFWVIATWRWLIEMVDAREEWKVAQDWLSRRQGALVAADAAARRLSTLVRVNPGTPMASNLSEKQQFLKRINEVIKSQEDRGVGTGLERDHRWRKAAPGAREGVIDGKLAPAPTAGSSANASKQLKRRQNTFRANGVPSEIESARVTALTPLSAATYTAMYIQRREEKNGKHAWVSDCSNIAAASNIPTQVYEHMNGGQFRGVPQALKQLHVPQFELVPSSSFLCLLHNTPEQIRNVGIKLSASDSELYKKVNTHLKGVVSAVKALGARKTSSGRGKGKNKISATDPEKRVESDQESDCPEHFPEHISGW
ncbi:hypothetical protein R3P38DRAFT_2583003, partial [Favolaschia claudopus]